MKMIQIRTCFINKGCAGVHTTARTTARTIATAIATAIAIAVLSSCSLLGSRSAPSPSPPTPIAAQAANARALATWHQSPTDFRVRLRAVEPQLTAADVAEFELTTERDGFVMLIGVQTDGQEVVTLWPNKIDNNNQLAAGRHRLPRDGWQLATTGPAGIGSVYALVCTKPVDAESVRVSIVGGIAPPAKGECGSGLAVYRELAVK